MCYKFPMEPRYKKNRTWLAVLGWMALIFAFSSIPDLRSGLEPLWDTILRKLAHTAEYAILGWLSFRAFERSGMKRPHAAIFAILLSVLYAISDEWHQHFIAGRHGAPIDVLIDTFGSVMGTLMRYRY